MKTLIKVAVPVIIILVSVGAYRWQMAHRPEPKTRQQERVIPIVRTVEAELVEGYRYQVSAYGTVEPASKVAIVSEVSGKVIWQSDRMKSGGMFRKGEGMYRIDDTVYKAAVDAKTAALKEAEYSLQKIEEEAAISNKEWEIWNSTGGGVRKPGALVSYGPQLEAAKSAVQSAQSALVSAQSDLAKVLYKAPFSSVVSDESIEIGKIIRVGESAGTLVGTESYEVYVPVSAKDAVRLTFSEDAEKASDGYIELTEGKDGWRWPVHAERILPDADSKTGMLKAVLRIENPFDTENGVKPILPLGASVKAVLMNRARAEMVRIPDEALQEGGVVWVLTPDSRLQIRSVTVTEKRGDHAYIGTGLSAGEKIITSPLKGAVDGMNVNTGTKKNGGDK